MTRSSAIPDAVIRELPSRGTVAVAAAGLSLAAVIGSWQDLARTRTLDLDVSVGAVVLNQLGWWWAWVPLLPAIVVLARWFAPPTIGWPRALGLHALTGAIFTALVMAVTAPLLVWAEGMTLTAAVWLRAWRTATMFSFDLGLLVYAAIVGVTWASLHRTGDPTAASAGTGPTESRAGDALEQRANHIAVRIGSRTRFVPVNEILWVEAADYCARLHTANDDWLVRRSLQEFETELPADRFMRVHRSAIVATDAVRELRRDGSAGCAILSNGAQVAVARSRMTQVRQRLGKAAG